MWGLSAIGQQRGMSNGDKKNAYGVSMSQRKRVNIGMTSVVCVQRGNCNITPVLWFEAPSFNSCKVPHSCWPQWCCQRHNLQSLLVLGISLVCMVHFAVHFAVHIPPAVLFLLYSHWAFE
jgi:hypothetical protein